MTLFKICLHKIQIIILQYSFCLWLAKLASELFDWLTFSTSTEKVEFALSDWSGCCHEQDSMDISISIADVYQEGPSMALKPNKEFRQLMVSSRCSGQSEGTKTVDFFAHQKPNTQHPNDINKLSHLEDRSYSWGLMRVSRTIVVFRLWWYPKMRR